MAMAATTMSHSMTVRRERGGSFVIGDYRRRRQRPVVAELPP